MNEAAEPSSKDHLLRSHTRRCLVKIWACLYASPSLRSGMERHTEQRR